MKKVLIVAFLLALASTAEASWSQDKTARELVFLSTLVNDWRQTLVIADTPYRREKNKILGSKPHRDNVNLYFSGCLVGHALVAYALPDNYAKIWQDVWIGIESNVSDSNVEKGHTKEIAVGYKLTHTIRF